MRRLGLPLIFILAFLLRVVWLDRIPVGFTPDEASFGYDAYSILKTGKDQWGAPLPLVLQSFGDYKSPLYTYLTIPTVALFGLNKFAVRLPNALIGTLAVLITYLLVNELFGKRKLGILSALLLAISPWHIMLSRGAFEANLTTFFLPFGIFLFLKGLKNSKYLVFSAIILGINLFTYHSAKLVTPILLIVLLLIYRKELISKIKDKNIKIATIVFCAFLGLTLLTFFQGAGSRVAERSITNGSLDEAAVYRIKAVQNGLPDPIARLLHNKVQVTINRFITNYLSYFSLKFLFQSGPAETTYGMLPGTGVLYWFEIINLIFFIIILFKKTITKSLVIVIVWLILAPIPTALSTGVGYSANRVVIILPALTISSVIGFNELLIFLKKKFSVRTYKYILMTLLLLVVMSLVVIKQRYFINSPLISAKGMLDQNLEVFNWLNSQNLNGNFIISKSLSEPQIYAAFATKIDPKIYQSASKNWDYKNINVNWVDQIPVYNLGKFTFRTINWILTDKFEKNTLFVGRPDDFPIDVTVYKDFKYPNGQKAILVVKNE